MSGYIIKCPVFMKKLNNILEWHVFDSYEVHTDSAGEGFWGDAGAGVLPISRDSGKILIGLRSKYVNEPLTWGNFGGEIDTNSEKKNPEDAARRELSEEIGYSGDIEMVPAYVYRSPGGFTYYNYLGLVDSEFDPLLDDWETETARWVTLSELKSISPKHFGLHALLKNSMDEIKKYAK
jgi:8-oxo-dGTP pyrophosphatase MutT (NUDIX family)